MLLLALSCATAQATTTGVALVHGTGSQSDAYDDYWQAGKSVAGIHSVDGPD